MQRCEKQVREDIHYFLPSSPLPFVVEMCGISYCDGTYRQERVNSPICVLEYVAEGTGTVIVEGVAHTASAGDVYLLPMGSSHRYFSDGEHPWTKLFINAWGPVIPPLLTAYGLDGQVVFPSCPLEGLFRDLFALSGGAGPGGLPQETVMERCALKFHEILMGLSACLKGRAAPPDEAARLKNLIDSRLNQTVTIRELAELVKKVTGYEGEIVMDPTKPDGTPRKLTDISRIKATGWEPKIDLETGLRQTYEWFCQRYETGDFAQR